MWTMNGENPKPVEVQDFRRTTNHFRGIYETYLKFVKKYLNDRNV